MFLSALIFLSLFTTAVNLQKYHSYIQHWIFLKSCTDAFIKNFTSTQLVDINKLLTYNKDLLMFLQLLLFQTSMSFCQTTGAIGVQKEKYYYVSSLRITTLCYWRWSWNNAH